MSDGLHRKKIAIIAFTLISLFLFSNLYNADLQSGNLQAVSASSQGNALSDVSFLGSLSNTNATYSGDMNVLVMFNFSNQEALNSLLNNLSNPMSPQYGHFLSQSQFNSEFSPRFTTYNSAINYFRQYGVTVKETFGNRLVLSLQGSGENFSKAFNTHITSSGSGGLASYSPESQPQLPQWLAASVSHVIGLSSVRPHINMNFHKQGIYTQNSNASGISSLNAKTQFIYPVMPSPYNGAQLLYGSYFQPAYNETGLLGTVMPTNAVIASILWEGSYTSGSNTVYTAPYNPSDVYNYFNQSLPKSQPLPKIYGVPVGGALPPGTSAQNDTSGAAIENTLDLEMAGSTAPGASIYNVYGKNSTFTDLTLAFETTVNPGSSQPAQLNNVSVITNSWGSNDTVSTTWNQLLQECQARGITVLASSGDSGNDLSSPKSVSSIEAVQFPSTNAYETYGVVAVGGTNISISTTTYALQSQEVWYEPGTPENGGTLGSVGGISTNYTEPAWQSNSQANQVIKDQGRGVPDVAAVANNTLIYFSNTTKGSFYIVAGTSVSSPVLAGIIAEMDMYRAHEGQPWLGFLNPAIYQLGTEQYDPALSGGYSPALTPYYDVVLGHNANYSALPGYDLVTGMGSINAYNFLADLSGTKYNVTFRETGMNASNTWSVEVNGVSHNSNGSYVNFTLINGSYRFTVPVVGYNVSDPVAGNFTVHGSNVLIDLQFKRGYQVSFSQNILPSGTAWTMKAWNYTASTLNRTIQLYFPNGTYTYRVVSSDPNYYGSTGTFTVNGAALAIAVNFTRGIFNVTFVEEGLPSNHTWSVSNGTRTISTNNTSLTFTLLGGQYSFTVPPAGKYIANRTTISLNTDGMNKTVYLNFSYGYFITFNATGIPQGVQWNILIADYNESSTNSTITVEVQNGTYSYYAYYTDAGTKQHISGTVNVSGANVTVPLNFQPPRTLSEYYILYVTLIMLGLAVLVIGVLMLRKK